ncbi:hypothetical protein COCCADRAFT_24815 [Bipolaris zeicola 26-R-13]|uniref:Mid2 domain-containing protein n=1 Tax=Cochliobolus carbonum (strain 26-R-13) TaxID=930089 RepID=W6YB58_COCC2|nr:uncharacterized protein COCCADRAFT_24815 [Bipolaris zeicola 26-R-13]EUC35163.1 hypothetical protein COCCADRAFT_24815 [Bipolaris zeicola 26-R-13]
MGWLIEGLVAICTASLVVGSNGAKDRQNAGSSDTLDANRRIPVLPRQGLPFHNVTRVSETPSDTSRASTTYTTSVVFASTKTESSSISIFGEYTFPSTLSPSEPISSTLSRTSSNAPSTSSTPYISGTILQSVTKGESTPSTTSIPIVISSLVPQAEYISPALAEIRSSTTQLPVTTTDLFDMVLSSPSHTSSSSRLVNVTVASVTTSCTSLTLSSTPPTLPIASRSTTRLPLHAVSDLFNWLSPASSTIFTGNDRGSSSTAATTSIPTIIISQESALPSSEISINFSTSPTMVLHNTKTVSLPSAISYETSVVNIDWISLIFTRPNPQTITPTSSVMPARSTTSISSSVFLNGNFSGAVTTANPAVPTRSFVLDISSPTTVPFPGNKTFCSGISFAFVFSTGSPASRTRSSTYTQTMRTSLQPPSMSERFTLTSLIPTTTQSSASTVVTGTSAGQLSSNMISPLQPATTRETGATSSVTLLPFPAISLAFTSSRNASISRTIQASHTFSKPILPTRVGSSSSTSTTGSLHTSRISNLRFSSISRTAVPSTSVTPSSFVTKTKTRNSELPSQTISETDGIRETMKGQSTTLPPTSSATETEAAAAPPPLKPSETAGVVVGSTAGVLLAIVAAIFVVRRYHALKHNDESGPYPEMAYLYDPFPDNSERDSNANETSTLISGSAGIKPSASSRSRPLHRAPHNSLDDEYHHMHNTNSLRYSDPGNPFTNPTDPFLDWRSSRVISTSTTTAPALAAAVKTYSKGPQKPLPPLPLSRTRCTLADHIIPSPTLSPLPPLDCNLHRTPAISARNSVKSQRSLRRLNCLDRASRSYTPLPQHTKDSSWNRTSTHDLPLPVDMRSETPDSITLYANPSSCHLLPTVFSYTSSPNASSERTAVSAETSLKVGETPRSLLASLVDSSGVGDGEEVAYEDFPSPPETESRCWQKRRGGCSGCSG